MAWGSETSSSSVTKGLDLCKGSWQDAQFKVTEHPQGTQPRAGAGRRGPAGSPTPGRPGRQRC